MKRPMATLAVVVVLLSGCVMNTNVVIDSNPQGASVYVDHRLVGETPVTTRQSNAVWEDPGILLVMDGHRDVYGSLKKEIQATNLVVGLLLWAPSLLWAYGPEQYQYFDLIKE